MTRRDHRRAGVGTGDLLAALSIGALALVVRLLGIQLGLPWHHHWDEWWVVDNAQHMLRNPLWEPRIYQYGAPLSWLIALTVRECGALFPTILFDPNDTYFLHLVGRWWVAFLSSSGAVATYLAARWATLGDRGATTRAVFAALAYACAAELVAHGRYAVTDACLVAAVAWSLAFGARYARGGRARDAALTVTAAALAVAFKISAGPAMVIPAVLLLWRRPAGSRRVVWAVRLGAVPLAALVFFALNPHFIIHWHNAFNDVTVRVNQYERGGVPEFLVRRRGPDHALAIASLMTFQVFHRWPAASAVMAGIAYAGLAGALVRRNATCIAGTVHAVVVLGGLAVVSRAFLVRNYLVAVPVLCIGFGFALEWLLERARARLARTAFAAVFGAIFVAVPVGQAIRCQQQSVDQRVRAVDWIVAHRGTSKPVTVACTPDVARDAEVDERAEARGAIQRQEIHFTSDVHSAAEVERLRPDMVLDVSRPDVYGRGDDWRFTSVPGYHEVARFDANPYEHNFAITPTWMGRFDAVVLQRAVPVPK